MNTKQNYILDHSTLNANTGCRHWKNAIARRDFLFKFDVKEHWLDFHCYMTAHCEWPDNASKFRRTCHDPTCISGKHLKPYVPKVPQVKEQVPVERRIPKFRSFRRSKK